MALTYSSEMLGTLAIKQHNRNFKIDIRRGNCLAVFVYVRKNPDSTGKHDKYIHTLWNFFADEQHIKNIMKHEHNLLGDEVVSIKLNTYYKESMTLVKWLTKSGYKVTCYYKEEAKK